MHFWKAVNRLRSRQSKSLAQIIWGWLLFILIILLLIFLGIHIKGQKTTVSGNGMLPTISDQDEVLVDTLTYAFLSPARYDVVVFPLPYKPDTYQIKRIIGLPGETVHIADGTVYINGQALSGDKAKRTEMPGTASSVITLGDDEYFVLGDNREDSMDSRDATVGTVKRSQIIGKAFFTVWPMEHIGWVK